MKGNFFWITMLILSIVIISCKKKKDVQYHIPQSSEIQGVWKQDYNHDTLAFQQAPEWERLEFKGDSFFMQIRFRAESLTALNCYQSSWQEFTKGTYYITDGKIYFDGIITDSNYVVKVSGCHRSGANGGHLGISFLEPNLMLQVLDVANNDKPLEGSQFKVNMYRLQ